jgi:hypothetical protein
LSGGIRVSDYNITTNLGKDAAASFLPFPFEFTSRLGQIMRFDKIENEDTIVFNNPYVQGDQFPFGLTIPESPWDIKHTIFVAQPYLLAPVKLISVSRTAYVRNEDKFKDQDIGLLDVFCATRHIDFENRKFISLSKHEHAGSSQGMCKQLKIQSMPCRMYRALK